MKRLYFDRRRKIMTGKMAPRKKESERMREQVIGSQGNRVGKHEDVLKRLAPPTVG